MPFTNVTTGITAATPITTPSKVSAERSLFAHNDRNAILMASVTFIGQVAGVRSPVLRRFPRAPYLGDQFNSPTPGLLRLESHNGATGVSPVQSGGRAGAPGSPPADLILYRNQDA